METTSHETEITKLTTLPRSARPRCGVTTQKGTPCMGQSMSNGRCYLHNGLPRGVSPEGQVRQAAAARDHMKQMWSERWRPNGRKLSDEARTRISEAQKRRWAVFREQREMQEAG